MKPAFRLPFAALALLGLTTLGLLPACDTVDNPVPVKETVSAGRRDTLQLDSAEAARGLLTRAPEQHVLIEDYTGHQCGNCPRAARRANDLVAQYGERVVVVATHIGFYARLSPPLYTYDFTTPIGIELNNTFGIDNRGLPQGMVNRVIPTAATSPVVSDGSWSGLVADELARPAAQQLVLTPLHNEGSDTVRMKIHVKYLAARPGKTYNLVVNVLEDSLHHWQKDYSITDPTNPSKDDSTYIHRHALRAAPLGTYGELSAASPTAGLVVDRYLRYQLDPAWQAHHVILVAYLIEADTKRVVQVTEAHL